MSDGVREDAAFASANVLLASINGGKKRWLFVPPSGMPQLMKLYAALSPVGRDCVYKGHHTGCPCKGFVHKQLHISVADLEAYQVPYFEIDQLWEGDLILTLPNVGHAVTNFGKGPYY